MQHKKMNCIKSCAWKKLSDFSNQAAAEGWISKVESLIRVGLGLIEAKSPELLAMVDKVGQARKLSRKGRPDLWMLVDETRLYMLMQSSLGAL